MLRTKVIST